MEMAAKEGDSPVGYIDSAFWVGYLITTGHVEPRRKSARPLAKAKY